MIESGITLPYLKLQRFGDMAISYLLVFAIEN
jgi:hypothetical protein